MRTIISQTCNLPQKQKPSTDNKPAKVTQLQTLTLAELDGIAGAQGVISGIITSP